MLLDYNFTPNSISYKRSQITDTKLISQTGFIMNQYGAFPYIKNDYRNITFTKIRFSEFTSPETGNKLAAYKIKISYPGETDLIGFAVYLYTNNKIYIWQDPNRDIFTNPETISELPRNYLQFDNTALTFDNFNISLFEGDPQASFTVRYLPPIYLTIDDTVTSISDLSTAAFNIYQNAIFAMDKNLLQESSDTPTINHFYFVIDDSNSNLITPYTKVSDLVIPEAYHFDSLQIWDSEGNELNSSIDFCLSFQDPLLSVKTQSNVGNGIVFSELVNTDKLYLSYKPVLNPSNNLYTNDVYTSLESYNKTNKAITTLDKAVYSLGFNISKHTSFSNVNIKSNMITALYNVPLYTPLFP